MGVVWDKFQILSFFEGLLRGVLVFWGLVWGLFRVGVGCIDLMHLRAYLGLRSKEQETAEKQNSGETEKHRSRKAKQGSRERKKSRIAKKQKSRTVKKQRSKET